MPWYNRAMKRSRYNIFHSLAATVVLLAVVFMQGFANFWRLFMHGIDMSYFYEGYASYKTEEV